MKFDRGRKSDVYFYTRVGHPRRAAFNYSRVRACAVIGRDERVPLKDLFKSVG